MAKARKKARKSAVKRPAKKSRRVAKSKSIRKAPKAKAKRAKAPKEGAIARAIHAVTGAIHDTATLRRRMEGPETFED